MENRYYIENLTVYSWLFYILPCFRKKGPQVLREAGKIYYFDGSKLGLWVASLTPGFTKIKFERVDFSQADLRDEDGGLIWLKTLTEALLIQEDFENNVEFQKTVKKYGAMNRLKPFLSKCMAACSLTGGDVFSMLKLIFFIRIIHHRETASHSITFFMQERPWAAEIGAFAQERGINIISTGATHFYVRLFLLRLEGFKSFVKQILYYGMIAKHKMWEMISGKISGCADRPEPSRGYIMVGYYGHLNLNSPELYSDLFFSQRSLGFKRDILIYFGLPKAPVTDKEWKEIKEHGMSAVAVNPLAVKTPQVPVFHHKQKSKTGWKTNGLKNGGNRVIQRWLDYYISDYRKRHDYWVDFIIRHNVKMHVTWYKHDSEHCAILDALKTTGGVGVVYQRSFEHFPTPWTLTTADVVFGFSRLGAHIRQDTHSVIPYYVIVGFLGDHRFGLLRKQADGLRNALQNKGASKIVAYFDENATDHPRWNLAYKATLENYSYLLNRVLENSQFGLILKPKVPATLRSRLGPVSQLLRSAEKTGRCFVFEGGVLHGSYPPAAAALASDVAIHGHLFAATAGVESALVGTPTLLLDIEGTPPSPLHKLERGSVIFKDIDSLWKACTQHWNGKGVPGFGDWSYILNDIDPFRDGRADERMGVYLEWILEGLKANLPREIVLADAAERYSKIWGKDKILSVNCASKEHSPTSSGPALMENFK